MMEIKNKKYLDKGKRGLVFTGLYDGKHVLVKEHNPTSVINTLSNEAGMLQKLNSFGIGPRFIAYNGRQLIREYIIGERIEDFLEHSTIEEAKAVICESLLQCHTMDVAGINKFEMNHPYKHILVSKGRKIKISMIDFERCKYTEKPKNVTQICQYIARIQPMLERVGLSIDGELVKELGMEYKKHDFDEKVFKKLIRLFR